MRKGINCWALPGAFSVPEQIRYAASLGFDGIELTIKNTGDLQPDTSKEELRVIRDCAEDAGIQVLGVCCTLNWQCSLTSDSKASREMAKANLRRQIDFARALGSGAVLALPGFVGLDFKCGDLVGDSGQNAIPTWAETVDYSVAYDRSLAAFREIAPYAEDNGITVCIENIWGKFLLSPLEMRDFIDAVGSPCVAAYFDVGNVLLYGYPDHWIRALGPRIKRVHIKDFRRGTARLEGFVDLLTGDVDFQKVRGALREIGYDGWVTAEINAYREYPEQTARNCRAALSLLFDS